MEEKNKFTYSYSAPTETERMEIEDIKRRYAGDVKQEDGFMRLKSLDKKVRRFPVIFAIIMGIVGCLIFGLGLTFVLEWGIWIWGVIISVVGAAVMAVTYPVHVALLNLNKRKYGEEIIKLSDSLLKR